MLGILLNEKQRRELESLLSKEISNLLFIQHNRKHGAIIERGLREKEEILYSLLCLVGHQEKIQKRY